MLFNSPIFFVFLPIVFIGYWFIFGRSLKLQNIFILIVSYVFYAWWDWRFLGLIAFSSLVDYLCGLKIASSDKPIRKYYLMLSLGVNLGMLAFFKYFNFFINSAVDLMNLIGWEANYYSLQIILPVGISFYTFQTMSYSIDIYRGKMQPTKDLIAFFAYVSFFPQLVAGPIERASNLLPQFFRQRVFTYEQGRDGLQLILWGLFKKVVIADNCAVVVNQIFANYTEASVIELLVGAVLFAFQIYGDFSGYSDIAIGVAKLLGFELMINFRTPYFSRDIAEFWRRWHISLSTWFRDYLYIPLGGSKGNKWLSVRNIFIIFLVSGFWHGANWTFIFWGALNALYFLPGFLMNKNRAYLDVVAVGRKLPSLKEGGQMLFTFVLTCVAWIFFRSPTLGDAFSYIGSIFHHQLLPSSFNFFSYELRVAILLFLLLEWVGRNKSTFFQNIESKWFRYPVYIFIALLIVYLGVFNELQEFIYFQF